MKVIAWGCWSNERSITEEGQAGVIHGRLFESREAAEKYYQNAAGYFLNRDDPIVKVIVESFDKKKR
jgi:hypothetical protein